MLMAFLVPIGGLVYFFKTTFETAGNLETRIIGSLVGFIPLIFSAVMFLFLYLIGVVMRSYYLKKYSEEFREKFSVEKDIWYGIKAFPEDEEDGQEASK